MAVTHPTAVRDGITNYVVDLIDASGGGDLIINTSGDSEVATLPFGSTAFTASGSAGSQADGVAAVTPGDLPLEDTSATGGTAAKFVIADGASTTIIEGSVGASGEDINLSSVTITATDIVSITALTYTAPN